MVDVEVSTVINKPVHDVFVYVRDEGNMPKWDDDLIKATKTSDGPTNVGSTFHLDIKPFMGVSEGDGSCIGYEEDRLIKMRMTMGKMQPTTSHIFEPQGDATKFTRRVQIEASGAMKIMTPMMKSMIRKRNQKFLANLKRLIEAG